MKIRGRELIIVIVLFVIIISIAVILCYQKHILFFSPIQLIEGVDYTIRDSECLNQISIYVEDSYCDIASNPSCVRNGKYYCYEDKDIDGQKVNEILPEKLFFLTTGKNYMQTQIFPSEKRVDYIFYSSPYVSSPIYLVKIDTQRKCIDGVDEDGDGYCADDPDKLKRDCNDRKEKENVLRIRSSDASGRIISVDVNTLRICPIDPDKCDLSTTKCAICINPESKEYCDDSLDNNCDGKIDCMDPTCIEVYKKNTKDVLALCCNKESVISYDKTGMAHCCPVEQKAFFGRGEVYSSEGTSPKSICCNAEDYISFRSDGEPIQCCSKDKILLFGKLGTIGKDSSICCSQGDKAIYDKYGEPIKCCNVNSEILNNPDGSSMCCNPEENQLTKMGRIVGCCPKTSSLLYGLEGTEFAKGGDKQTSICCSPNDRATYSLGEREIIGLRGKREYITDYTISGMPNKCCSKDKEIIFGLEGTEFAKDGKTPVSLCCEKNDKVTWDNEGVPRECCSKDKEIIFGLEGTEFAKEGSMPTSICCEKSQTSLISYFANGIARECCASGEILKYGRKGTIYAKGGVMEESICCDKDKEAETDWNGQPIGCRKKCCNDDNDCSSYCQGRLPKLLIQEKCIDGICNAVEKKGLPWIGDICIETETDTKKCEKKITKAHLTCRNAITGCGSYCDKNAIQKMKCGKNGCTKSEIIDCGSELCIEHKFTGSLDEEIGKSDAECESCREFDSLNFVTRTTDFTMLNDEGHEYIGIGLGLMSKNLFLSLKTPEEVFIKITDVCDSCELNKKLRVIIRNHGFPGVQTFGDDSNIEVDTNYLINHVLPKIRTGEYNFDCVSEWIWAGCSVGGGKVGKVFMEASEKIFRVNKVYASASRVSTRKTDGFDIGIPILLKNGVFREIHTIFYPTREDIIYPGLPKYAYQTKVVEGEIGKMAVSIKSSDSDLIASISDEAMPCDFEIEETQRFEIDEKTTIVAMGDIILDAGKDTVKNGKSATLEINKLKVDCTKFNKLNNNFAKPLTKKEIEDIKELYESGFVSKSLYAEAEEMYEKRLECILNSDCYGPCPVGNLNCRYNCKNNLCVLEEMATTQKRENYEKYCGSMSLSPSSEDESLLDRIIKFVNKIFVNRESLLSPPEGVYTCLDENGEPTEKGNVLGVLIECDEKELNIRLKKVVECSEGCNNGKCIGGPVCVDEDLGMSGNSLNRKSKAYLCQDNGACMLDKLIKLSTEDKQNLIVFASEKEDSCKDTKTLNEIYCNGGRVESKEVGCVFGCIDGRCIDKTSGTMPKPPVRKCKDDDSSKNPPTAKDSSIYKKSKTYVIDETGKKISGTDVSDVCKDKKTLSERYCVSSSVAATKNIVCSKGCSNGICKK